ncbi:MAG: MurR/RpiR family transcriptional regulator [Bryobacteraceae bacterium]
MKTETSNGACLAKVRASLSSRSKLTTNIANFILRSPEVARNLSINALAQTCSVSVATISRFSRDLGYSGFKQFQIDLATAVAKDEAFSLEDFPHRVSPRTIIHQVFECNMRSLEETRRLMDHEVLVKVAEAVRSAHRVFVLGVGGSALAAREMVQRLLSLGLTALALEDPYFQIFATSNVNRKDIVIGISHTGQTASVVEGILQAARRGATTVALTNYPQSSLAAASKFALITAYREHRVNAAVSSSRIAQICIIDSLYFILGSWSEARTKRIAEQVEQRTRNVLRVREKRRS